MLLGTPEAPYFYKRNIFFLGLNRKVVEPTMHLPKSPFCFFPFCVLLSTKDLQYLPQSCTKAEKFMNDRCVFTNMKNAYSCRGKCFAFGNVPPDICPVQAQHS